MADPRSLAARDSDHSSVEYEAAAHDLLDQGQVFLCYDLAMQGLRRHPASVKLRELAALALIETGAHDEAKRLIEPIVERVIVDKGPFRRLHASLREVLDRLAQDDADDPSPEAVERIARLTQALEAALAKRHDAQLDAADAGALDLLGRVHREAWRHAGETRDLRLACDLYHESFRRKPDFTSGVSAASLAWLLGEQDLARELAQEVLDLAALRAEAEAMLADDDGEDAAGAAGDGGSERDRLDIFRRAAAVVEAAVLIGDSEQALAALAEHGDLARQHYAQTVALRRQLDQLAAHGVAVDPAVIERLKPPAVVVFTGHALDRPGETPRFWPALEPVVRAEIAARLERMDARIGYSSAACGGDLIFIEAMLERGAEVHIVLPFDLEDFVAANVRHAGPRWEMRFRNALKLAHSVTFATDEHYLGHDMLYRFGNQVLHGLATLRARFLSAAPHLLALWDCQPGSLIGGAADFIDHWHDVRTLQIVDLDELASAHRDDVPAAATAARKGKRAGGARRKPGRERVIRSMLFADLAGFSKLKEEHIPAFLDFVAKLEKALAKAAPRPEAINTWGDAIFAVMGSAVDLAEYALHLKDLVPGISGTLDGLPAPINVRISLHAGPVFEAMDPFSERQNFYGGHINRAARLEPVTVIGHVYATQQFVALLTAEMSSRREEADREGHAFVDPFSFHYVGVVSLAKNFGQTPVYQLMRGAAPASTKAAAAKAAE